MNESKILNGQNLTDIALRDTGNADNALEMALANGLSLTDDVAPGEIILPEDTNDVVQHVAYYRRRNLQPATAITSADESVAPIGGIEFMGIEIDFVVS